MDVVGYSDPLSVEPGQRIRFMVSCQQDSYHASIVRLIHGDPNPLGPGFKVEQLPTAVDGRHPGRRQPLRPGSCVLVPDHPLLEDLGSLSLAAWVYPTRLNGSRQGLLTKWLEPQSLGYGLFLEAEGDLALRLGDATSPASVRTRRPLRSGEWCFVGGSYDSAGSVVLLQQPLRFWPEDPSRCTVSARVELDGVARTGLPFLIAASWEQDSSGSLVPGNHFNGKIGEPCLIRGSLSAAELQAYAGGQDPPIDQRSFIACWDLSLEIASAEVIDSSGNSLHGRAINLPTRAVTGPRWSGREQCFGRAGPEYNAIHFHDDDLESAGWEPDFELELPADLRSGIYAARLRAGSFEDYVPFFVRAGVGKPAAQIVFLVPTLTYSAYANEHMLADQARQERLRRDLDSIVARASAYEQAVLAYILEHQLLSLYDLHSDGSGTCYSSRLRPNLTMRPKLNNAYLNYEAPHGLGADLYLTDWLEAIGHSYDVVTDEDLHAEGLDLLQPYKVLVTGSHPEYWTEAMFLATEEYLRGGGRLMYLGGQGFYWVTSIDPLRPHVVEVRRGEVGSRPWQSEPGEWYHSTTGERGGMWKSRGRPPQRLVGVGFTAMTGAGDDPGAPYRRQPASLDPSVAFIFEGVAEDELIGDFGLHLGAAAGWELDRADRSLGTPFHALVLASTCGSLPGYQRVIEELTETPTEAAEERDPAVRADLVYFSCPNGGAVFSVGSVSWCGSLSHNAYRNNVSTITNNVLRRFVADEPLS